MSALMRNLGLRLRSLQIATHIQKSSSANLSVQRLLSSSSRRYCVASSQNNETEDDRTETEVNEKQETQEGQNSTQEAAAVPPVPTSGRQPVNDRLRVLSKTDPTDFASKFASVTPQKAEEQRYNKYKKLPFPDQRARTSRPLRGAYIPSNSQWGTRPYDPRFDGSDYGDDRHDSYPSRPGGNQFRDRYRRTYADADDADFTDRFRNKAQRSSRYDDDTDYEDRQPARDTRRRRIVDYDEEEQDPMEDRRRLSKYDMEQDVEEYYDPKLNASRKSYPNNDNIDALKHTYISRTGSVGAKREFHTLSAATIYMDIRRSMHSAADESRFEPVSFSKPKAARSEADQFGTIASNEEEGGSLRVQEPSRTESFMSPAYEEEEIEEEEENFSPEQRMTMHRLVKTTIKFLKKGRLTEALDFFTESLDKGGFYYRRPELRYLYRALISECGKAGYRKMAFLLCKRMKERGLAMSPGVYTSLFNSIANSPWDAERNLQNIETLKQRMFSAGHTPNVINYNSIIKAYGHNGYLSEAFATIDEMIENNVRPRFDTFAFLLQACLTDKQNGFRNALLTWDKLKQRKVRATPYSWALLLRCARECHVKLPDEVLAQAKNYKSKLLATKAENQAPPTLQSTSELLDENTALPAILSDYEDVNRALAVTDYDEANAHLTKQKLEDQQLQMLINLESPGGRLQVLGGTSGVLVRMKRDKVRPDMKCLQELIECSDNMYDVLNAVNAANILKLKLDVIFFNVLIKKLVRLNNPDTAKAMLLQMKKRRIKPDIYTWGSFSWGVKSAGELDDLLKGMEAHGFVPNAAIMYTMFRNACNDVDLNLVCDLIELLPRYSITPTSQIVNVLEKLGQRVQTALLSQERKIPVIERKMKEVLESDPENFRKDWTTFKKFYREWLDQVPIEVAPKNPWLEYEMLKEMKKEAANESSEDAQNEVSANQRFRRQ